MRIGYPDGTWRRLQTGPGGSLWLETEFVAGWICAERLMVTGSGATVTSEVRIFPVPHVPPNQIQAVPRRYAGEWSERPEDVPPSGVTNRLLRATKLGHHWDVIDDLIDFIAETGGQDAVARFASETRLVKVKTRHQGRGKRRNDHEYAAVAIEYHRLVNELGLKNPTQELARRRRIPLKLARSLVNQARRKGFLSQTDRGRKGGTATEKAVKVFRTWRESQQDPKSP